METIRSVNNPLIKELKKQKMKGLLFLDTPKLVEDAMLSGIGFDSILVEEGKNFKFLDEKDIILVSSNIINALSNVKNNAGIIAVAQSISNTFSVPKCNFLVLDNVQDAGNVGTLIRTALGANFSDVYLLNCASINNDKVLRSSMGAIFKLNCYEMSREQFIANMKDYSGKLLCCDMNGEDLFQFNVTGQVGVVIGNEGSGVSGGIRKMCSHTVKLPMANNLESLNAAVSGSIIMYEISYRR